MSALIDFASKWVPIVVSSAVAVLAIIAPVTKSDYDNKALDALRWFEDKVLGLVFPTLKNPTPTA